ncbi:hypothetical protein CK203_034909 [Vitis vinifera]|uniref:Uncharacterized protein n=1 Tax=Vitis vinifera TaxID=29760 RepID=A0A438FYV1_VITVI|nr:hypothetical protein CK203_092133 [Vitis vinifera]RVW65124.1 hypothetical protein CK203_034909 [Vitis vinifera]
MLVQRRVMSWRRVATSLQAPAAHGLLLTFTLLLVLKLDHAVSYSWWFVSSFHTSVWIIFAPLWLFHAVVARGRFSLPAPSMPHDRHKTTHFSFMDSGHHFMPSQRRRCLLLLNYSFVYISSTVMVHREHPECIIIKRYSWAALIKCIAAVNLKIVFLPLLALEAAILIDNIRMCKALMPGDDESISDEAIWETLPHFWVAISMVFFIAATTFTLLKLCGDVAALGWWDLFINFGIAECFASIVCTRWYNPAIHRNSHIRQTGSSSMIIRYLDWNSGLVVSSDEDQHQSRLCDLQDIGGHIMKIPLVGFQILLFMRLEGTPSSARHIPIPLLFAPLFLLQGIGVLFALYRLVEKIVLLLHSAAGTERYFAISSKVRSYFGFLHHGSRLLGWWSIDEGSREEQARLYYAGASGLVFLYHHLVSFQMTSSFSSTLGVQI